MKHYKRQITTYIMLPVVFIILVLLRSEAVRVNIVWLEWTSHFLWGISFLSFGIWMMYIDQQERKESSATGKPLSLESSRESSSFLRRIDRTLGLSFLIVGIIWILLIVYSLIQSPELLNV